MKLAMILLAALLAQPRDSLLVVSWNAENFLDYRTDTTGRHTAGRFYAKCNAVAKTILLVAEREGRLPDAVALMEIGNRFVLERLIHSTPLHKLDYAIVHFDSPDRRGIDCALLYRRSRLHLIKAEPKCLLDSAGAVMPTRSILVAQFDSLAILVNHHPSKVGADSERRRAIAMTRMLAVMDSLGAAGVPHILSVGDFNDDVWRDGSPGTIKYNGSWEKIDGHFARGLRTREAVFDHPCLSEPDRTWGGLKPRRSFIGPRWNGGISDHYPLVIYMSFPNSISGRVNRMSVLYTAPKYPVPPMTLQGKTAGSEKESPEDE